MEAIRQLQRPPTQVREYGVFALRAFDQVRLGTISAEDTLLIHDLLHRGSTIHDDHGLVQYLELYKGD